MARARNIKPGFFKDSDLADAGPRAQLLFAGLWCLADKEGRLKDKPREIKAELFPYYDVDVHGELTVLERLGHVHRYVVDGVGVIEVINFKKHQSPHHTERASELPARPPEESASDCKSKEPEINGESTVNSPLPDGGNPPDSLIPDSLIPDSLIPDSLIPDSLIPDSGLTDLPKTSPDGGEPPPSEKPKRKCRIPDDFGLTPEREAAARAYWLTKNRPDLDPVDEMEKFIAYHGGKGEPNLDWDCVWKTWYCNAVKFNKPPAQVTPIRQAGQARDFSKIDYHAGAGTDGNF